MLGVGPVVHNIICKNCRNQKDLGSCQHRQQNEPGIDSPLHSDQSSGPTGWMGCVSQVHYKDSQPHCNSHRQCRRAKDGDHNYRHTSGDDMPSCQVTRLGQGRVIGSEKENRRCTKRTDQQWVTNQSRYSPIARRPMVALRQLQAA